LKGLAIGNPCTDELIDHNAFFEMVASHDVLPPALSASIIAECPEQFRYIVDNSCCQFNYTDYPEQSPSCKASLNKMYELFRGNNLYDLYSTCIGGDQGSAPCVANDNLNNFLNTDAFRQVLDSRFNSSLYFSLFFKNKKKVVHAKLTSEIGIWYDCTPNLDYTSNYASIFKQIWPQIFTLRPDLYVMIYSGDADCCVPFFGTQKWTALLGGAVTDEWRSWQSEGQLAGYTIGYEKLRFTTLKGIGHMAPMFGPTQSFTMFQNYLNHNFPKTPVLRMSQEQQRPLAK
jgi:carboxypeptidase C (cathepsin A)